MPDPTTIGYGVAGGAAAIAVARFMVEKWVKARETFEATHAEKLAVLERDLTEKIALVDKEGNRCREENGTMFSALREERHAAIKLLSDSTRAEIASMDERAHREIGLLRERSHDLGGKVGALATAVEINVQMVNDLGEKMEKVMTEHAKQVATINQTLVQLTTIIGERLPKAHRQSQRAIDTDLDAR